jgi:hypothetical protein
VARGNRWRIVVELTFDPAPDEEDYEDEDEPHVARQALERIRPKLNSLLKSDYGDPRVKGAEFAHYHILEQPKRCFE